MSMETTAVTLERLNPGRLAGYYGIGITEEQQAYVTIRKAGLIRRDLFSWGRVRLRLICRGREVLGYLGMWIDPRIGQFTIAPFIIDKRHQREGIGREALRLACGEFFAAGAPRVKLAVRPGNEAAEAFYTKEGFRFTDEIWGEKDRVMSLEKDRFEQKGETP